MSTITTELGVNKLPVYDASYNSTGCCPKFKADGWDDREVHFRDKLFVKASTRSLMHVPLNMGKVFKRTLEAIEAANAQDMNQFVVFSRDLSPWSAEHLFAVETDVPGQTMTRLSGDFLTKVYQGPYRDTGQWCTELRELASARGYTPGEVYFFYTMCPSCSKTYGKNYMVGFVEVTR